MFDSHSTINLPFQSSEKISDPLARQTIARVPSQPSGTSTDDRIIIFLAKSDLSHGVPLMFARSCQKQEHIIYYFLEYYKIIGVDRFLRNQGIIPFLRYRFISDW